MDAADTASADPFGPPLAIASIEISQRLVVRSPANGPCRNSTSSAAVDVIPSPATILEFHVSPPLDVCLAFKAVCFERSSITVTLHSSTELQFCQALRANPLLFHYRILLTLEQVDAFLYNG